LKLNINRQAACSPVTFLAYLRGIETHMLASVLAYRQEFLAYLRGIETNKDGVELAEVAEFLAYLRGIETPAFHG